MKSFRSVIVDGKRYICERARACLREPLIGRCGVNTNFVCCVYVIMSVDCGKVLGLCLLAFSRIFRIMKFL